MLDTDKDTIFDRKLSIYNSISITHEENYSKNTSKNSNISKIITNDLYIFVKLDNYQAIKVCLPNKVKFKFIDLGIFCIKWKVFSDTRM